MSRIATVFGATGTQGSSVVHAILKDGTFTARAITRDVTSSSAKDLKSQGAQVVQADVSDEESVKKALEGSEVVFIVSVAFSAVPEVTQATNIINASKAVGVKYVVWSSLPEATKSTNGEYTDLHHFDAKAAVDDILRASGIPHSIVHLAVFLENIWKFAEIPGFVDVLKSSPSKDSYTLSLIRTKGKPLPFVYIARDLGASVVTLFKSYNDESKKGKLLGQTFVLATELLTGKEFAEILAKALGKPVNFVDLAESGIPMIDHTYDFSIKYFQPEVTGVPDRRLVDLGVKFSSVKEFVEDNKARLLAL